MLASLIVDDELWISKTLAQWLEEAFDGAEVRLARTNIEAVKVLRSFDPTLVITDFHHPGGDGKELLAELRKNPKTHNVPVVLVSAAAPHRGLDRAGFDAVLTQPCGYKEFMDAIKRLLNLNIDPDITKLAVG